MIYKKSSCKEIKIFFLILIFLFAFNFSGFAEEMQWTVSALEFTFTQNTKKSEYENSLLKVIPKLILEQLNGVKVRNVPSSEQLDRDIDKLVKERLSLFLELSSQTKKRDSYVLSNISEYEFNKQVKEIEKKIEDIQKKIDENLIAQEKILSEAKTENELFENFSIYKGDSSELFEFSKAAKDGELSDYQKMTEVTNAKINALITGTVTKYGDYVAVSAELFLYPGAKSQGVVTEIGSINKIETIAKNIGYRLIPKIENAIPCEVLIKFSNEELRSLAKLTVDDTIYPQVPQKIILGSGVHNLTFECDGYRKESFSYGFGYEKKYIIEIDFVKSDSLNMALSLKNPINGTLFYNGNASENNTVSVKVNNMSVLGYYFTKNDNSLYFMIPQKLLANDTSFLLKIKDTDISANIEKRRKIMYISYSALICSLPYLFYSYSNYTNLYKSYSFGNIIDINDFYKYQTMSYIGIGITAGLGCWFAYELVRYLISANKALPVEVKASKIGFETSVADFNAMQELFKAMEAEEQKRQQIEEMQDKIESEEKE